MLIDSEVLVFLIGSEQSVEYYELIYMALKFTFFK